MVHFLIKAVPLLTLLTLAIACTETQTETTPPPPCTHDMVLTKGPLVLPFQSGVWLIRWEGATSVQGAQCLKVAFDGVATDAPVQIREHIMEAKELAVPRDEFEDVKYLYEAVVTVPAGAAVTWSLTLSDTTIQGKFNSAPDSEAHLAVIGDADTRRVDGDTPVTSKLLSMIRAADENLLVHTGDIVYHLYSDNWQHFFSVYADTFRQMPFLPVLGNHEYVEFLGEADQYGIPYLGARDGSRVVVADSGPLRLITLDSNTDQREFTSTAQAAMWAAVEAALAGAGSRMKVLVFHHPIYTRSEHLPRLDLRDKVLALDAKYDIQLILNGHNHVYERFAIPGKFHEIVAGGGGGYLYPLPAHDNDDAESKLYTVAAKASFHWVELTATTSGIGLKAVNLAGEVIDQATLDIR